MSYHGVQLPQAMPDGVLTPLDSFGVVPPPPRPLLNRADSGLIDVPGYRVVGQLGAGGMGVVYEAVQVALGRSVALKLLPMGWSADSELADRLRAEAAALARLHHPNIVQIFEVGAAHGRPYLALELISGGSLAQRLRAGPLVPKESAMLVAQLAGAVAHAHDIGIVHRDLKPANILLSKDEGGRMKDEPESTSDSSFIPHPSSFTPKITDFGLAKTADAGHTRTGAVLGTPSYMAPEQASGVRDVGPPADIYALGAVMYECLTGRPPFRATSDLETLDLVRSVEPVPPRRLQPGVPRDLETVCLKCLAKAPAKRYDSARTLAEDLERFLTGQTVRARRTGPLERLSKWARRRPAVAALWAVIAAVVAAGIAGVALHTTKLRAALELVSREKTRADDDYRASRTAMKGMLELFADPRYVDVPRVIELRNSQYEQALTYYASVIARQDDPDLAVRLDVARAYLESADLRSALGRPAIAEYRQAVARFRAVALAAPEQLDARLQLGASLGALSVELTADPSAQVEAADAAAEAVTIHTELVRLDPSSIAYGDALAQSHNYVGGIQFHRQDFSSAERAYAAAADSWAARVSDHPRDRARLRSLAQVQINLSMVVQTLDRLDDALRRRNDAMATLEKLLTINPRDRQSASSLTLLRVNWAYTQEPEEALVELDKNLAMLTPLLAFEPNDARLRHAMYCTIGMRALKYEALKRPLEAAQEIQRAVEFAGADNIQVRIDAAGCWVRAGDPARALKLADELVDSATPAGVSSLARQLPQIYVDAARATTKDHPPTDDDRKQWLAHGTRQIRMLFEKARQDLPAEQWRKLRGELLADAPLRPLFEDDRIRTLLQD